MPGLTIKNIPVNVHRRLRRVAHLKRRSVNGQAIVCLDKGLRAEEPLNVKKFLLEVRRMRRWTAAMPLTSKMLDTAINKGRP